jgi:hypothetical protein
MKHLGDAVATYDFDRRIKTLKGLTLCGPLQAWQKQPGDFSQNPHH